VQSIRRVAARLRGGAARGLLPGGTTAASGRSIGIITFFVWLLWLYFSELVNDGNFLWRIYYLPIRSIYKFLERGKIVACVCLLADAEGMSNRRKIIYAACCK
jgi:hypothetical protein